MLKALTDIKTYIVLGVFFMGTIVYAFGYVELPNKVKKVSKDVTDNTVSIQQLTNNIDKYIAVNEVEKKERDKREQMLLDILDVMKGK